MLRLTLSTAAAALHRHVWLVVTYVVMAVFVVTACSISSTAPPGTQGSTSGDPGAQGNISDSLSSVCDLLTDSEVEGLFQALVKEDPWITDPAEPSKQQSCTWSSLQPIRSLIVIVTCGSTADPNTVFDTTPVEGAPPNTTRVTQGPYMTYYVERGECDISSSAENIDENRVVRALNLLHERLG